MSPVSVDLYWLPLGAGGWFVRLNGRVYELVTASLGRRPRRDLYHSALEVRVPEGRFAIETAPVPDGGGAGRGVVAEGPVGSRRAVRFRIFRYEIRCWPACGPVEHAAGACRASHTAWLRWVADR